MALFSNSGDKSKKPSFFQRVRQAFTGETEVPPAEQPRASEPAPPPVAPAPEPAPQTAAQTHHEPAAFTEAIVVPEFQQIDVEELTEGAEDELLKRPIVGAAPPALESELATEPAVPEPQPEARPAPVEGRAPEHAPLPPQPAAPAHEGVAEPAAAPETPRFFESEPPSVQAEPQRTPEPAAAPAHPAVTPQAPPAAERNEFGLRPMTSNFSFGGYATAAEEDESFVGRMREAVSRTAEQLNSSLDQVLAFTRTVDEGTLDDLEAVLLTADIGMTTTQEVIRSLRQRALRENSTTGPELKAMLKEELRAILDAVEQPTDHPPKPPEVIMLVGVNGTGKTTTSGKLAALYGTHGRRALLCAADTFRAAAIEQLEVWARRSNVEIIKTRQGGDPSAALYDSLTAGKARNVDIVIVDTAGRLHNKAGLMAELDKMRRTAEKLVPGAPHQTFLVMDATTGQNGMQQARLFTEAAHVTGIILTKLDGTAKGGIVIAIARELGLPVVFAGVGEKMEDIVPFDSDAFLDSLLGA